MDTDGYGCTISSAAARALITVLAQADYLAEIAGIGYLGADPCALLRRQIKALSFIVGAALPESERPDELRLVLDAGAKAKE